MKRRPGRAADRLRRLRWMLTLMFTAINAAGLIALAWIAVSIDSDKGEEHLDGQLTTVTSTVSRLLYFDTDNTTLVTAGASADEINDQCPQFAVLPGASGQFPGYFSARTCVPVDPALLGGFANDAARSGRLLSGYTRGTGGQVVRIGVAPFRNRYGQYIGAVVAVSDAGPARTAHRDFVLLVAGACAGLIAALAVAGHFLSSRAIRPAAAALEQQEILLAETAHDLRTPVAALRALAETALRNPTQRSDLLPRTVRLAIRMGGIIDSLLIRARLAAGVDQLAIQPVWLDQLVTGVIEEAPTGHATVTVTAAPSKVYADPGLVQRAIGNLLDNAIRYGRKPDESAVVHVTVVGGRVTVADHGPGVDDAIADGGLDRFGTSNGSTGLGLSIVRWVAQAHGGSLNVYNADEGGAIFELSLPTGPDRG